jgi:hypothetical protein
VGLSDAGNESNQACARHSDAQRKTQKVLPTIAGAANVGIRIAGNHSGLHIQNRVHSLPASSKIVYHTSATALGAILEALGQFAGVRPNRNMTARADFPVNCGEFGGLGLTTVAQPKIRQKGV